MKRYATIKSMPISTEPIAMNSVLQKRLYGSKGFSIIEIMIGLAIGLASLLVIYQLYSVSEGRRRTIESTGDAQTVGAIALYNIERDIKSSGVGLGVMDASYLNCTVNAFNSERASEPLFNFRLLPVLINAKPAEESDEIRVLIGNTSTLGAGKRFVDSTGRTLKMEKAHTGIQTGDMLVAIPDVAAVTPPDNCLLLEVTSLEADGRSIKYESGASYQDFYSEKNVTATRNNDKTVGGGEGVVYSLGNNPALNVWRVTDASKLVVHNDLVTTAAEAVEVAQDIVRMKAEYGYDTNGDGMIATGSKGSEWKSSLDPGDDWSRVLAIRVAILVRASHYEKEEVTQNSPVWGAGSNKNNFVMSTLGDDWKHYRYRVYESIIPMRNSVLGR